jgi:hypothetical protein
MAQPEYVPVSPRERVRVAERLPTPDQWTATRPAEIGPGGFQPAGRMLGIQGPDQGYALKLASLLRPSAMLAQGESFEDASSGCVGVALRRAALYGRAPIMPDVKLAFTVWGFLEGAPADLVEFRRRLFEGIAHHHEAQRAIAERVPEETLRLTPADVAARLGGEGWRFLLGLEGSS